MPKSNQEYLDDFDKMFKFLPSKVNVGDNFYVAVERKDKVRNLITNLLSSKDQEKEEALKNCREEFKYWIEDWWNEGQPYGLDGILKKLYGSGSRHVCIKDEVYQDYETLKKVARADVVKDMENIFSRYIGKENATLDIILIKILDELK